MYMPFQGSKILNNSPKRFNIPNNQRAQLGKTKSIKDELKVELIDTKNRESYILLKDEFLATLQVFQGTN